MTYLVGENLTGGYGSGPSILNGCNISVDRGEIAVIVGPNGAGKSTAMKSFLGLLNLKEGSVTLDGKDITHLAPEARIARVLRSYRKLKTYLLV
jgi:branched-chain amino acid transport system ATP-binding protein